MPKTVGFLEKKATGTASSFSGFLTNQVGKREVSFTDMPITKHSDGLPPTLEELGQYSCLDFNIDNSDPGAPTAKDIVLFTSSEMTGSLIDTLGDSIRKITLAMKESVTNVTLIMRKK